MSPENLAGFLNVAPEHVSEEYLEIDAAFQHGKRGDETKLILADTASQRAETLLKNIAKPSPRSPALKASRSAVSRM